MSLLQIHSSVCQRKKIEKRLIFAEVTGKSLMSRFFDSRCSLSLSLRGILFLSVALSTVECQCSREPAFFHAYEGPMFSGLRSGSMVLSHVWLGLPGGRFQSDGGLRIAAATARWWSSSAALRAMCSRRISTVVLLPWHCPDFYILVIWRMFQFFLSLYACRLSMYCK